MQLEYSNNVPQRFKGVPIESCDVMDFIWTVLDASDCLFNRSAKI